jgi:co-chaperonin GroES (HSP10)
MKIKPMGENLVVRFLPKQQQEEQKTATGILLMPSKETASPMLIAEILAVGPGTRHINLNGEVHLIGIPYEVGQKVVCARKNGLLLDEPELFLIPAGEVLAICE